MEVKTFSKKLKDLLHGRYEIITRTCEATEDTLFILISKGSKCLALAFKYDGEKIYSLINGYATATEIKLIIDLTQNG